MARHLLVEPMMTQLTDAKMRHLASVIWMKTLEIQIHISVKRRTGLFSKK